MACRKAYKTRMITIEAEEYQPQVKGPVAAPKVERLFFGVDSKTNANDLLQNNIDEFEWVVRNKIYPNFFGRHINGENALTKEEAKYLHGKGCKIALICTDGGPKNSEEQGVSFANEIAKLMNELDVPHGTAIFVDLSYGNVTKAYMHGYAKKMLENGYVPGFMANTDAANGFDREFSVGMQNERAVFEKCLIWAVAPTLKEYDGMTTSHFIHPDNWKPFAPSAIKRNQIAVWQYGRDCHPIDDDEGNATSFNVDLVRNVDVIIDKMF